MRTKALNEDTIILRNIYAFSNQGLMCEMSGVDYHHLSTCTITCLMN
jgi:hypothetical protein